MFRVSAARLVQALAVAATFAGFAGACSVELAALCEVDPSDPLCQPDCQANPSDPRCQGQGGTGGTGGAGGSGGAGGTEGSGASGGAGGCADNKALCLNATPTTETGLGACAGDANAITEGEGDTAKLIDTTSVACGNHAAALAVLFWCGVEASSVEKAWQGFHQVITADTDGEYELTVHDRSKNIKAGSQQKEAVVTSITGDNGKIGVSGSGSGSNANGYIVYAASTNGDKCTYPPPSDLSQGWASGRTYDVTLAKIGPNEEIGPVGIGTSGSSKFFWPATNSAQINGSVSFSGISPTFLKLITLAGGSDEQLAVVQTGEVNIFSASLVDSLEVMPSTTVTQAGIVDAIASNIYDDDQDELLVATKGGVSSYKADGSALDMMGYNVSNLMGVVRIVSGDIDGDGDNDLIVLTQSDTEFTPVVYENAGGFEKVESSLGSFSARADTTPMLELFDIDGDGDVDLVYVAEDADGNGYTVGVYVNQLIDKSK